MKFQINPLCSKKLLARLIFDFALISAVLVSFSARAAVNDINRIFHEKYTLANFEVCQGGGCAQISQVSLNDEEWRKVAILFTPMPSSAERERTQISLAIGVLEEIVGAKIGTSADLAGTFFDGKLAGQQDCNDEAINSTTYMRLLAQAGFLHFNQIDDIHTRNFFFTGWPHSTAVIHDLETDNQFAVDSWFYDNGHPATIVPFKVWKANYKPDDSPIGKVRENPTKTQTVHVNP